ncbi:amino acid adenylation domain-containing protein [Psychrobacillus sp. L4]|uniref:amino acid adenylation domain-containing protein n=1 Tax=Psychrobacillus sp. L4 TaxID=3236892 RepID=UPI0036F216CD
MKKVSKLENNKFERKMELLSAKEKEQLLYDFNNTNVKYPEDMTIQKMFEEQVEKEPNKMAVKFEDRHLTYQELNDRANSLARVLIAKGVKANSIVGIMVERSLQMVVGIMGILKAGVAYLPIDPNYPEDRINYLLSDSQCDFLITQTDFMDKLSFNGLLVDLYCSENFEQSTENINPIYNPEDLAYIIYTSGTTGNPKGVMVQNNNLVNATYFWRRHYRLNDFDVNLLQLAGVSFDVFAGDLSRSLLSGGTMHIVSYETKLDMQKLFEIIMSEKITIFESTPNHILAFTRYLKQKKLKLENLRLLILGSDSCSISDYKTLVEEYGNQIRILNSYGVTEATIDSSYYESSYENIPDISNTPIGKPLDNTKFYILDKNQKMQPMEVCGELYIAGKGIARGYLNRPELTKEKFVANPFEPGTKMYKTGDLARWLPDGNVEFLGRIDNQVKIRGFRIELGEVEDGLLQHRAVSEAIVVSRDNKENGKYLCAYIVCEDEVNNLELKNFIKKGLPDYMVPAYIVQLENMPLTPNGKIDRKALPEPNIENLILDEYESPRNEVEEKLVEIWSETLGVKKIGINDNFFDLGGHSLNALTLISHIHKKLKREVQIKELFELPTIKSLSNFIENIRENEYSNIEKVGERETYEASSAQKRMFILQQYFIGSTAYNIPVFFELTGDVNKEKIERTFKALVARHEILRTYFANIEGRIVQIIDQFYDFKLNESISDKEIENIINNFIRPFELDKASLFRVELIRNKDKFYLLIDMHHIIIDGLSVTILMNEFKTLYEGGTLKPLKLQYKDFSAWQNNLLKNKEVGSQEEYWLNLFNDEIPVLNLPYDYERPLLNTQDGAIVDFLIDENISAALKKLAKETGSTIHMVLMSAFNILLSKYSGQEDIIIGIPTAGRINVDLHNILGMFVNTLALRNKPKAEMKILDFLFEVKENSLKAYENQSYQFEVLVEKLNVDRDTNRNPLFDVMFNIIDKESTIELENLTLKEFHFENKTSKFDLTLNVLEEDSIYKFFIEYSPNLFKKETIEMMGNHFIRILYEIINKSQLKISEIDLLSIEEKYQLLL